MARELPEPSVFAHEILNANPYAFLDDAPLEERRTRAVSVRRGLPAEVVERHGRPRPGGGRRRWSPRRSPSPRNADELHDLLLDLGVLPEALGRARGLGELFEALVAAPARGAARGQSPTSTGSPPSGASLAAAVWPARRFAPDVVEPPRAARPRLERRARARWPRSCAATCALAGPTTAERWRRASACRRRTIDAALARVELDGAVLRGRFVADARATASTQWCDRRLLARINRRTLDGLRREIEPVTRRRLPALPARLAARRARARQLHGQRRAGAR